MVKTKINTRKQHQNKGYQFIGIGIVLLMIVSGVAGYYLNTFQENLAITSSKTRLTRINDIYQSLKLDDTKYQLDRSDVFGDKRVYDWDAGRTFSSSQTYERGANVDTTVAELRKSIEAAGFNYFEEPYPGSTYTQLHFKSAKNEYVRLTVSSKPRDDTLRNSILMNTDTSVAVEMNPNVGPSNVTIKVNLDDNNE